MKGLFVILACWLAGNYLSMLIDGYLSGNIIGMLLLFTLLCCGVVKGETVRGAAKFLLGTMALFFVPFGVGLMESYGVIMDNIAAIVIATVVSTFGVIVTVGWVFQLLNSKNNG
ncbi:MAG: CidA/LrgA family protein [Alistipes sp.]|jgi:holin-like protein|nr:CidA/LrgA family protein [Alistipes sp.]